MRSAMTTTAPRNRLIEALADALRAQPWALAAWLAGSDANGRTDAFSDIDLVIIVEDDRVEEAVALCEAAVRTVAPISFTLRLPQPTWHGHDQVFWQFDGLPDYLMVDCVIERRGTTAARFLEVERHGKPIVLFDREGLVRAEPFDRAGHERTVRQRLEALVPRFRLLQHLVRKAIWRGDIAEAADRYLTFTLRPLVELMRIRYCPDRFDFGMRYLRSDLPEPAWRAVESIALPGSLAELAAHHAAALALFDMELAGLRSDQSVRI